MENPPFTDLPSVDKTAGKSPFLLSKWTVLLLSILVLVLISGSVIYSSKSTLKQDPDLMSGSFPSDPGLIKPEISPKPTPFLFEELTVPFLRGREYKSSLGELSEASGNSTFTTYLTSYDSDGLKINALLTKPAGDPPEGGWPAVVFIHGYIPPSQYQTQLRYIDHVNTLAGSGLVVFKIDLRGHGNSEGEPGGGYYSSDYLIDGLNARAALQSSGFVSPGKIGFWGHSMAGNVVARIIAVKPEVSAAVIWAGAGYTYTDLREYGIQDSSYQPQPSDSERQKKRQLLRQTYGDPNSESEFWKSVIPVNYFSDFKGAIQMHHAVNDDVVSIEYSRNLKRILDQTSVPHELHEYPSGGHNISGASFNSAIQRSADFFKQNLK